MLQSIHAAYGRMDQGHAREKLFEGKHPLIILYPVDTFRKRLLFTSLMPWQFLIVWPMFAVLIHVFQPQGGGMGANNPEAALFVAALKKRGTQAWGLLAKDEGHGFRKKPNVEFQAAATAVFVKRFLLDNGKVELRRFLDEGRAGEKVASTERYI